MRFFCGLKKVGRGAFEPTYMNTERLAADMLTIAMGRNKLTHCRSILLSSIEKEVLRTVSTCQDYRPMRTKGVAVNQISTRQSWN